MRVIWLPFGIQRRPIIWSSSRTRDPLKWYFVIFLIGCELSGVSEASDANSAGVLAALTAPPLRQSPPRPTLSLTPHDLLLTVAETRPLLLTLSRAVPHSVRVRFHLSDAIVLAAVDDVTVPAGQSAPVSVQLTSLTKGGHCTVLANVTSPLDTVNVDQLYARVTVLQSFQLRVFSGAVGWLYFGAWTISFYPQIYSNFQRKSVDGLNFDFLLLNFVGFLFYFVFNISVYCSPAVQSTYFRAHPHGLVPVAANDVVFALHAVFACAITGLQCCCYERGSQRVSAAARTLLAVFVCVVAVALTLSLCAAITWLSLLYVLSYIKLLITVVKYIPQAWQNYRRASTEGWSIGNVLLDFTGGTLSLLQMVVDAFNYSDWSSVFGNPTKFGLGVFSIGFDILFVVQHYCLYRSRSAYQTLDVSVDEAVEVVAQQP